MCACQVRNMDVIPHAGAVRSGVVSAKDGNGFALAQSDLECQRNQVRLGVMIFPLFASGAGRVEIPQAGIAKPMNEVEPGEHLLHEMLRGPISLRRLKFVSLFDWSAFRSSEQCRGGGEHKA